MTRHERNPAPQGAAPATLPTLNDDGSRRWIRPRVSKGRFLSARRIVAYVLIGIFAIIPYLRMNGKPLVLLDLTSRRFTLFGATFLPTDTLLLALLVVGVFLGIFLLTALFGRVWCGWACPQTVYMEFVFRPIERLCEGPPGRVAKSRFVTSGAGRIVKPFLYFLVSCFLAHTFLAYFVGVEKLRVWVTQSPLEHPTPFLVMVTVTALMLFDFGYFREQTCLVACPYGRFQSALLDQQSLIIGYDRARGEPRGKRGKPRASRDVALPVLEESTSARSGDCVDCNLCVATCPTGIDIRNGLQMECIGCAQCIDACDAVMAKLGRPTGLIRYSSGARLAGERPRLLRGRTVVYPLLLMVVATGFVLALLGQQPADVTVLRGLGRVYTQLEDGAIENNVRIKIINRTDEAREYTLSATDPAGYSTLRTDENPVRIGAGESRTIPVMLVAPPAAFSTGILETAVRVEDRHGFVKEQKYRMQGPIPRGSPSGAPHRREEQP